MYKLFEIVSKCTSSSVFIRYNYKFSESNLKKLLETMPKEPKHIADAQRQRLKIKDKSQKYVPSKVTLQVLGSGAEGAPKALYMFTDHSRYLFNCGEGTQRLAHEHKMKLSKLEHIFITQPTWNNMGGLPGVSLTIQDVGVPQITLHGPEGLDELFIATRRFVILRDLKIRMAECKSNQKYEDNVMNVTYVPLVKSQDDFVDIKSSCSTVKQVPDVPQSTGNSRNRNRSRTRNGNNSSDDETDYYAHEQSGTREVPPSLPQVTYEEKEQNITMCYVCRLSPRPGALSLDKCVEAGVPPGPLLGQLKAGNDITLANGTVVKSADVCLPDDPGPIFLVVDCPSTEYLNSLLNNEIFSQYQSTAKSDDNLACLVVHFTPSHILQNPRYREWVDKFSPSTQHLVLNDANSCMGSISVHRIQYKLNMLHSYMFPILGDKGTKLLNEENDVGEPVIKKFKTESEVKYSCDTTNLLGNLSVDCRPNTPEDIYNQAQTFCNYHLRPKKGLDRSNELSINRVEYIEETTAIEGFEDLLTELKEKLSQMKNVTIRPYPKILFLGTGSCIPNKTRNTSGILITTSDTSSFLMDCGEGTYGQLVRFFGYEKAKVVLSNLKAVYISHLHADHHIGLIGLLKGRRKAIENLGQPSKPVLLFAPKQILAWLHFYHRRFEKISEEYNLISNGDMIFNSSHLTQDQKESLKELGITNIGTTLVKHCPNAYGVTFNHEDGWKLTYSGDTMPCERLVELGMNSDVLIHEATMEDELLDEAIHKMHSTTSQAIEIGQKMKAKHILLTHFSQRYAKLPRFNDNFADNVGIAFDNMQVRLDELPIVPLLYPALRSMFAEHYEELEHKAVKRQLRAERRDVSLDRQST